MNVFHQKQYDELKKKKQEGQLSAPAAPQKTASASKQSSSQTSDPIRTTIMRSSTQKKEKEQKWYSGSEPTEVETLAKIYQNSLTDKETARYQYGLYEQAKQEGMWAETYDKATSRYAAALGLPEGTEINDAFFEAMAPYFSAGVTTDAGNLSTAKKNGADALFAANLAGLYDDYQKTKSLQSEELAAMKEAAYWMDQGLTDDEIKQKLNIGGEGSKYKGLTSALAKTKTGEYEPTTAPIRLLTSYGVDGMLYALRNPDSATGDYKMNAVKAALGQGVKYTATDEEIASRTPGSETWSPYTAGTTMHDEAIILGTGASVSPEWFEQNRSRILMNGTEEEKKAFASMWEAEQRTAQAEAEYAALMDAANLAMKDASLYDNADELIDELFLDVDGNPNYGMLTKLDDSLLSGEVVGLTRGVGYDRKSFETAVRQEFEVRKANADAANDPAALEKAVEIEKQELVKKNGTVRDSSTLPKSQTNEVVSVFEELPEDIMKEAVVWAGATLPSAKQRSHQKDLQLKLALGELPPEDIKEEKEEETEASSETPARYSDQQMLTLAASGEVDPEALGTMFQNKYGFTSQEMNAAIEEEDYSAASDMLKADYDEKIAQNPELLTTDGAQKTAIVALLFANEAGILTDPEQVEKAKELQDAVDASMALDMNGEVGSAFIRSLDGLLNMNGALIAAQENDGLGLNSTLMLLWDTAMSKGAGLVDDLIGQALITIGSVVDSEKLVTSGEHIAAVEEQTQAGINQILEKHGTPIEILTAKYGGEAVHMTQMGQISSGLMSFAKAKLGGSLKFLTRMIGSLPFAAEAGTSEFHETYTETGDTLVSSATGLAASAVTAVMSNWDGVLKNIEAKGLPYIPEVVEKLSTAPASGAMAGIGRWGKSFMLWLGNMGKTAFNEALQEPAENVATTFLTDLIKGENPFDRDWAEYSKELKAEAVGAAILSLASSAPTLSTYARSVKVAESQMGKAELTAADVDTFVSALKEDMKDPQLVAEMQWRAGRIAVETRIGELLSEREPVQFDPTIMEASQTAVGEYEKALTEFSRARNEYEHADIQFRVATDDFNKDPSNDNKKKRVLDLMKRRDDLAKDLEAASAARDAAQQRHQEAFSAFNANLDALYGDIWKKAETEVEQALAETAVAKEQAELESLPYAERFSREFDKWDKKQIGKEFVVGHTSETLLSLGVPDADINLLSDKLIKIQKKHPAMTDEVIKQIPNIIENPVVVMKSRTVPDRLTMFGEVMDANGNPVLAIIDTSMKANTKTGRIDIDVIRLNSAYGKDTDAQGFIDRSEVVYVDKNRADNWSRSTRLYLPIGEDTNGSDNSIAQNADAVNTSVPSDGQENAVDHVSDGISRTQVPPQTAAPSSGEQQSSGRTGVSQFAAQTGQNTTVLSDKVKKDLRESPYYQKTTQQKNMDKAIAAIDRDGYDRRKNKLLDGTTNLFSPEGQAEAFVLARAAKETGDVEGEAAIAFKVKESGTILGQSLAMRQLYVSMTPEGKQQYVQRFVDQINDRYERSGKDTRVSAPDWLADRLKATEGDEDATARVVEEAFANIAQQMPPDWKTRLNAWRYTAMLANPRTHIRNFFGNGLFAPVVGAKNKLASLMELSLDKTERTKSIGPVKKEYKEFAREQLESVSELLTGGGKHSPMSTIQQERRNFNSNVLEWLSKGNGKLLEKEDAFFLNRHFVNAMSGFLQARGADVNSVDKATLNEALDYAVNEAQKATYRDASEIAEKISKFTRDLSNSEKKTSQAAGILIEGALPFKKTPINIMKRGIEYSPIGLVSTLATWSHDVKTEKATQAEVLDRLASGLTGTGLAGIGGLLWKLGALKLDLDDPEDELEKLQGSQEYSIELWGKSVTIDWLSPAAMPLFVGGAIAELMSSDGEELNLNTFTDALMNIAEPVFNLSMLDGVNTLLSAASYSDNGVADITARAAESYATQFVPTILGAFARTVDKIRRTTYTDKNIGVPASLQYLADSTINKIPELSKTGQPYLNAWGEEDVTENWWARALENFVLPGYVNSLDTDDVEQHLMELFDTTGETGLIPKTPQKYFTVGGERIDLTGEQYERLTKERGQKAKNLHEELFANPEFMDLPAEYQTKALEYVWDYADATSKHAINDGVEVAAWMRGDDIQQEIMQKVQDNKRKDERDGFKQSMYEAIDSGDPAVAATCVAALVESGLDSSNIRSSVTGRYKSQYRDLYDNGDVAGMRDLEDSLILLNIGYKRSDFTKWLD